MSVKAIANGVKISPRKVSVVASLVRGRTIEDAVVILNNTPRPKSSLAVKKVIESAKANAIHNHGYRSEGLYIQSILVNHGPRLKRIRPVAKGIAHGITRRTSHITVIVDGTLREVKKPTKTSTPKSVNQSKKESK